MDLGKPALSLARAKKTLVFSPMKNTLERRGAPQGGRKQRVVTLRCASTQMAGDNAMDDPNSEEGSQRPLYPD